MSKILVCLLLLAYFGSTRVLAVEGGIAAKPGQYPFMVSIRDPYNCHICGGTIIADKWVLTSNPCYSRSFFGSVRFGTTSLDNSCGAYDNSTQIKVSDVFYNPWFSDVPPYTHDAVLVQLNASIPFSDNVKAVKLPVLDETWPYNQTGIIIGWGGLKYYERQTELQAAEIPLFTDEYCIQPKLWNGWVPADPYVMKCGGVVNKTFACFYDYGGPLLNNGKQYGIISYMYPGYAEQCGGYLGIYSPVSYFRTWINETAGV